MPRNDPEAISVRAIARDASYSIVGAKIKRQNRRKGLDSVLTVYILMGVEEMIMSKRIGPRMLEAVYFVAGHPGCAIRPCADAISPCPVPSRNNAYGYNPVHRAIDAGLISATYSRGRYSLTLTDAGNALLDGVS